MLSANHLGARRGWWPSLSIQRPLSLGRCMGLFDARRTIHILGGGCGTGTLHHRFGIYGIHVVWITVGIFYKRSYYKERDSAHRLVVVVVVPLVSDNGVKQTVRKKARELLYFPAF